ncbi:MAG: FAD-binding oxidoreductase [Alphaproteobacteria bacterium]|nr:FAD-binding oxidoreductase [Alphaproteobacteria bacterium]
MTVAARAPASLAPDFVRRLEAAVGRGLLDSADGAPYLTEWRGLWRAKNAVVVRPASTEEVAEVVRLCAEALVPIVPQGGNTGLTGGSIPYEDEAAVVVNLGRMNRVRAVDPLNYAMTVEAGCILQTLQRTAEEADRLFPLSLGAEGSCQIGGNLSTNAGGVAVLKYGNARDLVLGLEVVLADGTIWDGLRGLRKDNTGYDLKQLFLGAEGTLGIITAAVLKLFPKPRDKRTSFVALRDLDAAIELLVRMRSATGDQVASFEYLPRNCLQMALDHIPGVADPMSRVYDHYALIEVSRTADEDAGFAEHVEAALGKAVEDGLVLDAAVAQSQAQAAMFWKIRDSMAEAQKGEGPAIRHDIAVPVSRIPAFYRECRGRVLARLPEARIHGFGHVGDGNLHYNIAAPRGMDSQAFLALMGEINGVVHDCVAEYQGSISAEHGIGRLRRAELPRYKGAVELALMRKVKAALDPLGIMNPGKVI